VSIWKPHGAQRHRARFTGPSHRRADTQFIAMRKILASRLPPLQDVQKDRDAALLRDFWLANGACRTAPVSPGSEKVKVNPADMFDSGLASTAPAATARKATISAPVKAICLILAPGAERVRYDSIRNVQPLGRGIQSSARATEPPASGLRLPGASVDAQDIKPEMEVIHLNTLILHYNPPSSSCLAHRG